MYGVALDAARLGRPDIEFEISLELPGALKDPWLLLLLLLAATGSVRTQGVVIRLGETKNDDETKEGLNLRSLIRGRCVLEAEDIELSLFVS